MSEQSQSAPMPGISTAEVQSLYRPYWLWLDQVREMQEGCVDYFVDTLQSINRTVCDLSRQQAAYVSRMSEIGRNWNGQAIQQWREMQDGATEQFRQSWSTAVDTSTSSLEQNMDRWSELLQRQSDQFATVAQASVHPNSGAAQG